MKTKVFASALILLLSVSILGFLFITGCGTVTSSGGGGGVPGNPKLYVSDITNKRVLVFSASTTEGVVVATIELTGATTPEWMGINSDGSKVYVSDSGDDKVFVIRTDLDTVEAIVTIYNKPQGSAFNTKTNQMMFALGSDSDIAFIDASNATGPNLCGVGPYPNYGMAYNPKDNRAYVATYGDNRINVVTAESSYTGQSVKFDLDKPYDVAVAPGGNVVYVTTGYRNSGAGDFIVSYEASSMTIVASWEVGNGSMAYKHIAVSPNGQYIYAGVHDASYIDYLDPSSSVIKHIYALLPGMFDWDSSNVYGREQIVFSPDSSKAFVISNYTPGASIHSAEVVVIDAILATREAAIPLPGGADYFGIVYKP